MISSDPARAVSRASRLAALMAAGAVLLLIAGCDGGGGDEDTGPSASSADGKEKVELYFTAGEQFEPVEHEVAGSTNAPREATEALMKGPEAVAPEAAADEDAETLIPPGVEVEKVAVDDSGEARVDLSEEFLGAIPADPEDRTRAQNEAVSARLGQVTYTLTSFERVDSVKVRSGGVAVEAPDRRSGGASPTEQARSDFSEPPAVPKVPKVRGGSGGLAAGTQSLQRKLADLGYLPPSGVDGIAGYQTQQATMAFQAWEGLDRDGVAGPATKAALSTAKRPKPRTKNPRRFMEVDLDKGVLLLVKDGRTKRAIHVSGGAPATATPTGRYRVFRKELMSWSVPFSTWLPFASYFNNGIAFHEYPDVPPYPASHGCVRVPTPEAKRVYNFARMNTVVVVRP